jgi:hypothetical protein
LALKGILPQQLPPDRGAEELSGERQPSPAGVLSQFLPLVVCLRDKVNPEGVGVAEGDVRMAK